MDRRWGPTKLIDMKYSFCLLSVFLMLSSCYYDVEEELYITLECATDGVTYTNTVVPLLQENCLSCHSTTANFGGVTLEGYDRLITYVNNGELLGVIRHTPGFSPMPNNAPQLLECEIEKISAWVESGALEN